jgi:Raf kinase inhibitor-like YbhB/YbcL family protein
MAFEIRSPAFPDGERIPGKYARAGSNVNPPLTWSAAPSGARELVLLVEDPDAPGPEPFVHWIVYGLPATLVGLPEGGSAPPPASLREGKNSFGRVGYDGPAPPPGQPHRYHFKLYALDQPVELGQPPDKRSLLAASKGHVLAEADLVGTFQNQARRAV